MAAFAAALPCSAFADPDCADSEYVVKGRFGVNPVVSDLPPRLGLPGGESAELASFQAAWLAEANRERDQENVTFDPATGTITQVNVYDGGTMSTSIEGLRAAELDPSTNSGNGQLNMNWCMPAGRQDGLLFAIYEVGGSVAGFQAGPFAVDEQGNATAVLNEAITNQVGLEFNTGGADETREDIETVTGMYPPRYLAEAIFQRDIPAMLRDEVVNQALFHHPVDGVVVGNLFIVTGDNARAYTPTAVERVLYNGSNILDGSNAVGDLDQRLGPVSLEVDGERRPAYVMDGRADLDVAVTACTGGVASLQATFERASLLHSVVELWRGDSLLESGTNAAVDAFAICNGTYQLRGFRSIRGQIVDAETESIELVSATVEIVGVDLDGDPSTAEILDVNPANGTFDSGVAAIANCGTDPDPSVAQLLVVPPVAGNFSNSALPANMDFDQATGVIQFAPACAQLGEVYEITFTFTDGSTTSTPKTLQFAVVP